MDDYSLFPRSHLNYVCERALARLVDGRMRSHQLGSSTPVSCKKRKKNPLAYSRSKEQLGSGLSRDRPLCTDGAEVR
jgi:hypothetical protein